MSRSAGEAVDSSVALAAFAPWHEQHDAAHRAVGGRPWIIGHAALETYSVLTRMPPSHRAPADVVLGYLQRAYGERTVVLSAGEFPALLAELGAAEVAGGASYDGLIGVTARQAGLTLLTLDRRAVPVYQLLRVEHRVLA